MNIASINYYFGDKERLYIEAVKEAARHCEAAAPLPAGPRGTQPATQLREFIATFLRRVVLDREPAWHGRLIMREIFQPTRACVEFVQDFVRPAFTALLAILAELLPPDVPPVRRHLLAFSIVGQCLHYRIARPVVTLLVGQAEFDSFSVDQLTDHITAFSLAGLERAARPEGGPS